MDVPRIHTGLTGELTLNQGFLEGIVQTAAAERYRQVCFSMCSYAYSYVCSYVCPYECVTKKD